MPSLGLRLAFVSYNRVFLLSSSSVVLSRSWANVFGGWPGHLIVHPCGIFCHALWLGDLFAGSVPSQSNAGLNELLGLPVGPDGSGFVRYRITAIAQYL